jgi:hypothetical protein
LSCRLPMFIPIRAYGKIRKYPWKSVKIGEMGN